MPDLHWLPRDSNLRSAVTYLRSQPQDPPYRTLIDVEARYQPATVV